MPASAQDISAGGAFVRIWADDGPLRKGLDRAAARLKSWGDSITSLGKKIFAIGGIGGGLLAEAVNVFASYTGELRQAQAITQISGEHLSAMGYAAVQLGGSLEDVTHGMAHMANFIREVRDGSESAIRTLDRLGVGVEEILALPLEQAYYRLGSATNGLTNSTERLIAARQILGRGGVDTLRVFGAGEARFRELMREAEERGVVTTQADIEAGRQLARTWNETKAMGLALVRQIGAALVPNMLQLFTVMQSVIAPTLQFVRENRGLVAILDKLILYVTAAGGALIGLGGALRVVSYALGGLYPIFAVVKSVVVAVIGLVMAVVTTTYSLIVGTIATGLSLMAGAVGLILTALPALAVMALATLGLILQPILALVATVGVAAALLAVAAVAAVTFAVALVPLGVALAAVIIPSLLAMLPLVASAAIVMAALTAAFIAATIALAPLIGTFAFITATVVGMAAVIAAIPVVALAAGTALFAIGLYAQYGLLRGLGILSFFSRTLSGIWEGIKATASGAWTWIKDTAAPVTDAIKGYFSSLWDWLKDVFGDIGSGATYLWDSLVSGIGGALGRAGELAREWGAGFLEVWSAINGAVVANEWGLALEVAWQGIRVTFIGLVNFLKAMWREFRDWLIESVMAMGATALRRLQDAMGGLPAWLRNMLGFNAIGAAAASLEEGGAGQSEQRRRIREAQAEGDETQLREARANLEYLEWLAEINRMFAEGRAARNLPPPPDNNPLVPPGTTAFGTFSAQEAAGQGATETAQERLQQAVENQTMELSERLANVVAAVEAIQLGTVFR